MHLSILKQLQQNPLKKLAVLIDPDSLSGEEAVNTLIAHCNSAEVDLILVGGSLITNGFWNDCVSTIKKLTDIPVILFPGNLMQTHDEADAILLSFNCVNLLAPKLNAAVKFSSASLFFPFSNR